MFIEITDEQRTNGKFRPYAAMPIWIYEIRDGKGPIGVRKTRPGHRLANGNWLIPAGCLSLDRTERERAIADFVIDKLDL
jgi:hypothetical protein